MSSVHTENASPTVHFCAGWPGKALCGWGAFQSSGPVTSLDKEKVTCERCNEMLSPAAATPASKSEAAAAFESPSRFGATRSRMIL